MVKNLQEEKRPFITVGLAFYNVEKTVASAVKSVLMQTYDNFELIIIDDGSTDHSFDVVQKLAEADARIKVTRGEKNIGVGPRLNQITDMARGEYIVRMDADDMMLPNRIEKQMELLLADRNLDLIDCAAYIINERGEPVGRRKNNDISDLTLRKVLKSRTVFFHPTIIAKTAWFRKNRYNDDYKRGPDFELWCRTFGNTHYNRIEEPLFLYREGKVSIRNYEISAVSFRRTLHTYAKGNLSAFELNKEIAFSHLRTFLYRFFGFFGLQHLLTATRNETLSKDEKEKISGLISQIEDFTVAQTATEQKIVNNSI
jgi:glycosyltransferase involved in cell wall biosynthesis